MTQAALDTGSTMLLVAACVAAALITPTLPLVGVPMVAVATASLTYRRAPRAAAAAAALAGIAAVIVFRPVLGVLTALVLAIAGPLAARFLRTWSPWRVMALVALAVFGMTVGAFADALSTSGQTFAHFVDQTVREASAIAAPALQGDAAAVARQADLARMFLTQLWPSVMLVVATLTAAVSVRLTGWIAERTGEHVRELPRLEMFDVSWHVVWALTASLLLLAFDRFTDGAYSWTQIVGLNLMIPLRVVLFVQGLGVFASWYRKAGLGKVGRGASYVMLGIAEAIMPLAGLVGLVDLWVDFRKLRTRREDVGPQDRLAS